MKQPLPIITLLTVLFLLLAITVPPDSQAGFMNKVNQSISKSQSSISKSVTRTKKQVRQKTSSFRKKTKQKRQYIQNKINRDKKRAQELARRKKQQLKKQYAGQQKKYSSTIRRSKESAQKKISYASSKYKKTAKKAHKQVTYKRSAVSKKIKTTMRQVTKRYGNAAKNTLMATQKKYGTKVTQVLAVQMTRAEKNGLQAVKKSTALVHEVGRRVRNPRLRQKAMLGAAVAGGVAYYAYTHQDDIKYKTFRYGMDNIRIPLNGRTVPASEVVSKAILQQAPYLRGTRIAEDPAAVLAYGVVAVGKDDLINRVDLVPDGHGGMRTINQTIQSTEHGNEAMAALQLSSSIEGMALNAAAQGELGRYGEEFASSYNTMENMNNAYSN